MATGEAQGVHQASKGPNGQSEKGRTEGKSEKRTQQVVGYFGGGR